MTYTLKIIAAPGENDPIVIRIGCPTREEEDLCITAAAAQELIYRLQGAIETVTNWSPDQRGPELN